MSDKIKDEHVKNLSEELNIKQQELKEKLLEKMKADFEKTRECFICKQEKRTFILKVNNKNYEICFKCAEDIVSKHIEIMENIKENCNIN